LGVSGAESFPTLLFPRSLPSMMMFGVVVITSLKTNKLKHKQKCEKRLCWILESSRRRHIDAWKSP
jgi:hypothetical protein